MARDFMARSGPPELILEILRKCESVRDILSFTATCHRLHNVWQAGAASVLWPVSLRKDPEFDDALIASRLSTLVHQAEARGELPPTALSPGDFSGHRQAPTIPEIKAATTFGRLVGFLAVGLSELDIDVPNDRAGAFKNRRGPEDPARMPEWEARVRKALYRFFVCAAALAGAYNEPLFQARASGDPVIKNLVHRFRAEEDRDTGLSDHELDFLEQFTVCDLRASPDAEEAVFGPLCDWLLHSILSDSESRQAYADRFEKGLGRALCCSNISGSGPCLYPDELARGDGSHSDAHLVVWDVIKMIWLDHHLTEIITPERMRETEKRLQKAVAVFFGVFRAEEAFLPERTDGSAHYPILTDFAISQEGDDEEPEYGNPVDAEDVFFFQYRQYTKPSVALFFSCILDRSDRSPKSTNTPAAPLRYKFFDFFLRRSTGLRMSGFEWSYAELVRNYGILAHDDVEGRKATLYDAEGFSDGSMFFGADTYSDG